MIASLDFTPDEVEAFKRKLIQLSNAKVVVRGPERDENGRCIYIEVDDHGIQLAATVKGLEFAVGKPKQMMEIATGPSAAGQRTSQSDLARLLSKNPDLTSTIIETLKAGIKSAQAIDVTPLNPGNSEGHTDSQSVTH